MKAKKIEVQPWPIGRHESWTGKTPLGCNTVRMHVLLCEMGGVWVMSHGEHVALPGRQMDPSERPRDIVEWVVRNQSNNLPESKQRWVSSPAKPLAFAHDGVCHVFVQISVHRFAPAPSSLLRLVSVSELQEMLPDKDAVLASAMFAPAEVEQKDEVAA